MSVPGLFESTSGHLSASCDGSSCVGKTQVFGSKQCSIIAASLKAIENNLCRIVIYTTER